MHDFNGRVAVVTGAASGIGLATAHRFADEGTNLVLADIEPGALAAAEEALTAKGVDVLAVMTDVSSADAVERLADAAFERFDNVHVVFNNAGVAATAATLRQRAWEGALGDWEWTLGINLMGVVHGVRAFVPRMLANGDEGHIVNTASMAGLMTAANPYNVSKHAVVTLSETLSVDLQIAGATGVGVSVLCPGWVKTRIHESARNRPVDDPEFDDALMVSAPDVAGVIGGLIENGLDPAEVAGLVTDAVEGDHFYVITHGDWKAGITDRTSRMVEGLPPILMSPM